MIFLGSNNCFSQINIVDVPTAEAAEKGKLFFQEEVYVGDRNIKSSTTFTWGLGKNFDFGFNIYQITFNTRPHSKDIVLDPNDPERNPDLLLNSKKEFKANEWISFGLGTQSGVNVVRHKSDLQFLNLSYLNSQLSIPNTETILVIGSYYANHAYAGEGTKWGLMAGIQAEIIKDKFNLIGDLHTGTNSLSVINTGIEIALPKGWQIDIVYQLPMPGTNNTGGGLIQLSRK
jgi:hypothetical protein